MLSSIAMRLSIKTKLLILISFACLGLTLLGGLLWNTSSVMGRHLEELSMKNFPSARKAQELQTVKARQAANLAFFVASKDERYLKGTKRGRNDLICCWRNWVSMNRLLKVKRSWLR